MSGTVHRKDLPDAQDTDAPPASPGDDSLASAPLPPPPPSSANPAPDDAELRFRSVFENTGAATIIVEEDTTIAQANTAFEHLSGYPRQEIEGLKHWTEFFIRESLPRMMRHHQLRRIDPEAAPQRFESKFVDRYGRLRDVVLTEGLIPGTGRGVVSITDLTDSYRAERALRASEEKYRVLFEKLPDFLFRTDARGRIILASPSCAKILGYSLEEILGLDFHELMASPDEREAFRTALDRDGSVEEFESLFITREGNLIWGATSAHRYTDAFGNALGIEGLTRNISRRKDAQEAMRQAEKRYRSIFENAIEGIFLLSYEGRFLSANPAMANILGYDTPEELMNEVTDLERQLYVDPFQRRVIMQRLTQSELFSDFESKVYRRDGGIIWVSEKLRAVRGADGEILHFEGSLQDITERKLVEEQLRYQAFHDILTGLPNRALFLDRLSRAIERAKRRENYLFAVLMIDLDRFKVVNDSLGHLVGDKLLQTIARSLQTIMRSIDTVARIGGDEFAIIMEEIASPKEAIHVADRVRREMLRSFSIDDHEVFTSASIGIVLSTREYESSEQVLRDADIAMYRAKALGKSRHKVFHARMRVQAVSLQRLETDLRRAVDRREFLVQYQPIVDLAAGKLWGVEALIRWRHPDRGLIQPDEFIPVAEETGLIVPIGEWVIRRACEQLARWRVEYPAAKGLIVSVNLSARQFSQQGLFELIDDALRQAGLPGDRLKIEITESVLMRNAEYAISILRRLKALGVKVAIDDFGTGYSSLSYLQRLPIDTLKVDRSFVSRMSVNEESHELVRTIIELAHGLNLNVVSEGVEHPEQISHLLDLGCEYAQGFHFSRPLQEDDVVRLLSGQDLALFKME